VARNLDYQSPSITSPLDGVRVHATFASGGPVDAFISGTAYVGVRGARDLGAGWSISSIGSHLQQGYRGFHPARRLQKHRPHGQRRLHLMMEQRTSLKSGATRNFTH
jgi:hypothetical protein